MLFSQPRAFYRGTASMLAMVPLSSSIMFTAYGKMCHWLQLRGNRTRLSAHHFFAAGSFAGVCSALSYCPAELVKLRLQMQHIDAASTVRYSGTFDCFRHILRTEGIRGLYRGIGATLWRDIPATGAWYGGYEVARAYWSGGADKPSNLINVLSGARCINNFGVLFPTRYVSRDPITAVNCGIWSEAGSFGGVCYWLLGFPQDVAKTRIQRSPLPPTQRPSTLPPLSLLMTPPDFPVRLLFRDGIVQTST
jgi:solute carrier family 25 carnitine/acylcarnitine transporter 20/29